MLRTKKQEAGNELTWDGERIYQWHGKGVMVETVTSCLFVTMHYGGTSLALVSSVLL